MSDADPPLKRLGDFELIREIGRGGMGIVYDARQVSLNRRVALKILPPGLGLTGQAVQRFEREAQAAAKLHHTNIVPVHAIGEEDGTHYYAMELIEGQALSEVLNDLSGSGSSRLMDATLTMIGGDENQADPATDPGLSTPNLDSSGITSLSDSSSGSRKWFDVAAKLISEVADALEYAHGRGVIHRDIKPANLMLSDAGRLCITDFGLARVAQEPGMTVSGSLMGTPAYMSPEQIASGRMKLDHRTDVYSLGAVLYEMLTHRRPFPGESREEILGGILTKEPRPPRRCNPRIPVDLETICQKAMEKDPDRRYATAGELAEDLRQYLTHGLIKARRAGIAKRTWKLVRRHPVKATVVVAVLIVVAASIFAWQAGGRAETAQRLVADARLALREGTYREGLQLIDRAVALDPAAIDARIVRARLLIVNYRMNEAAAEARWVLQTDPQNHAAHTVLASLALYPIKVEMLSYGGFSQEAYNLGSIDPESHVAFVEAEAPESAEAYFLRALTARTLFAKDPRQQIELLDRALDLNPGDQLASLARMIVLGDLQDHELVLSEADRLITARRKSAQGWRMKADAYRQQQDFENATAAIERAMEVDDRDPRNYLQKSWILRDKGEKDEALSDLSRAIELYPTHGFLYQHRAALLVSMGRYEEAIADARKSIELDPGENPGGLNALALSYLFLGRESELRALVDELRSQADGWLNLEAKAAASQATAVLYLQLEEFDRALAAIERAIVTGPDVPWHFFATRSGIREQLGDSEGAKADCEEAARINLDTPLQLLVRGQQLRMGPGLCNDIVGALEDFNRVIELAPNWHFGYLWRGMVHEQLEHPDTALVDFTRAIELGPYFPSPYGARGWLYLNQGRFEEALADYGKAMELDPYNPEWTVYGYLLFHHGRSEEALSAFEKALEINPRAGDAHVNRGSLLAHLGRCDEAVVELRKGVEVSFVWPATHYNIAEAHLAYFYYDCPNHYDVTEALSHAQAALEGRSSNQQIQALALLRKGDYAEAKRIYLEMFEETPDRTAWFPLAMCLWHLGEKAEARKFYNRSVSWMDERVPDSPMFINLREEAAELLGLDLPEAYIVH